MTLLAATVGQTVTLLAGKFEGRTATVRDIGSTGRTLCVEWVDNGARGFLIRNDTPVQVAA